jgi:hypothetical protein
MIDLFLLPFILFEWVFSFLVWYYLIRFILVTDYYWETKDKVKDMWYAYREK